MTSVVNLRQVRKQKARAGKERAADQNRALHGRTKAERTRHEQAAEKSQRFVEGHRRDKPSGDGGA